MRSLGDKLIVISALGIFGALSWWSTYYGRVIEYVVGPGAELPVRCLITSSGECWVIRGLGALTGEAPYEPISFWVSCSGLVVGLILRMSSTRK